MDQSALIRDITAAALARYGNFEKPDFHFVGPELKASPWRSILQQLEGLGAHITEDTDPNDDVSLNILIEKGAEALSLQLSLIGPYAALRRITSGRPIEAIAALNDSRTDLERRVMDIVSRGAKLLDRSTLLFPIKFNLSNMEPDETTIYNVLFTDGPSGL
jgi:hypothetical protein